MMHYGYGMMGYAGGWIMMILITILVAFGIIALLRCLQHSGNRNYQNHGNDALKILNERYAKGEISDEEYRRMKSELKS